MEVAIKVKYEIGEAVKVKGFKKTGVVFGYVISAENTFEYCVWIDDFGKHLTLHANEVMLEKVKKENEIEKV